MMVFQTVSAGSGHGMQLVVGELRKYSACHAQSVIKLIVGIVHLIDAEDGFQTALIERTVVCHERQSLNQWFNLCSYGGENRCVFGIFTGKSVYL